MFLKFLGLENPPAGVEQPLFVKAALKKICASASIFSIQLLFDWLSLDALFDLEPWESRINFPGTINEKNWTLTLSFSLEELLALPVNSVIKKINEETQRI